jgi:hypothetical protein
VPSGDQGFPIGRALVYAGRSDKHSPSEYAEPLRPVLLPAGYALSGLTRPRVVMDERTPLAMSF